MVLDDRNYWILDAEPVHPYEFFHRQGFKVYGVDISQTDIESAKKRLPEISDRLKVIPPKPSLDSDYFGVKFGVVIGIQAFYYFNHSDFTVMIESIFKQMNLTPLSMAR